MIGEEGGVGVGKEEATIQVKTQSPKFLTDGLDHTTRPKGHYSGQG